MPFQVTTTCASSGEMLANPWPPVLATSVTSGAGGAVAVTPMTHKLWPELADTGAARYLPLRDTTWQATHLTWSLEYTVPGLPVM